MWPLKKHQSNSEKHRKHGWNMTFLFQQWEEAQKAGRSYDLIVQNLMVRGFYLLISEKLFSKKVKTTSKRLCAM